MQQIYYLPTHPLSFPGSAKVWKPEDRVPQRDQPAFLEHSRWWFGKQQAAAHGPPRWVTLVVCQHR